MSQSEQPPSTNTISWKDIVIPLGVVLAAFIGYLGVRASTVIPIQATQTAEAKSTLAARSVVQPNSIVATSTPTPTETFSPTPPPISSTPTMTATPELLLLTGVWEGITGGMKNGSTLTEVTTTVSIPSNCKIGDSCGFFETYCKYEMTLIEIDGNVHSFETISVSGDDFCTGGTIPARAELTLLSDFKLFFYYETLSGSNITREGILTKQD